MFTNSVSKKIMMRDFRLQQTLERPKSNLDFGAVVATILFIFGLTLFGSRFIGAPGIPINLPSSPTTTLQLTDGVINIGINGTIFFQNQILHIDQFEEALNEFLASRLHPQDTTILMLIDRWTPWEMMVSLISIIKQAGCTKIQIACEPEAPLIV